MCRLGAMKLSDGAVLDGELRVQVGDPAVVQVQRVFGCGVVCAHCGCPVRPGLTGTCSLLLGKDRRRTACTRVASRLVLLKKFLSHP